jgi:Predicted nucleoside-diphosphate-sugar epimerases
MLLGATGLVGQECLRLLIDDESVSRVVVLSRRAILSSLKALKVEEHVIDFAELASCGVFFDVDQVICALGTTRRKTPSRDDYRAIDFEYPLTAARLALEHEARHFLIVSAVGANSKSRLFYNRLKGEVEDALKAMPFRSLTIAQPSVLIGERAEPRLSERIAWSLAFLTPAKYRPVHAGNVARALVHFARIDEPGLRIIPNRDLG